MPSRFTKKDNEVNEKRTVFLIKNGVNIITFACNSWVSLWDFETIRGSLKKPKW